MFGHSKPRCAARREIDFARGQCRHRFRHIAEGRLAFAGLFFVGFDLRALFEGGRSIFGAAVAGEHIGMAAN